jgi:hypothetical protein
MELWVTNDRTFIEKYYDSYLTTLKYLIGWIEEGQKLAKEFEPSGFKVKEPVDGAGPNNNGSRVLQGKKGNNKVKSTDNLLNVIDPFSTESTPKVFDSDMDRCNYASRMMKETQSSKSTVKADFSAAKSYIMKLVDIRRGFYCTLCDADSQEKISKMWLTAFRHNTNMPDKFIFGSQFCNEFSTNSLKFIKYITGTLRKYLNSLSVLMVCKMNSLNSRGAIEELNASNKKLTFDNVPVYEVNKENYSKYFRCEKLKNNTSVFACGDLCKLFDFTAPNPFIDGDILQNKMFFNFIKKNKNLFENPENNVLDEKFAESETQMAMIWNQLFNKPNFFSSNDQYGVMDRHNTLVFNGDGANPYVISDENGYLLENSFAGNFFANLMLVLLLLQFNLD